MDAEQEQTLLMQSHQLGKRLDQQKQQLKEGGLQALRGKIIYIQIILFAYFCTSRNLVALSC